MLLLSALFFRPARDKCTYSINKARDLKCSPTLGKKREKCEVLSAFSISSSHTEFVQIPDEKLVLFFSWEPVGLCQPFLWWWFQRKSQHSSTALPLQGDSTFSRGSCYLLQPPSLFLHGYRGQILRIETTLSTQPGECKHNLCFPSLLLCSQKF